MFMISGGPSLWMASFNASTQNSASSVFDSTRDVRDDAMQLQVHLHQSLLHVLDMGGGIFCESFALAHTMNRAGFAGG